MRIDLPRLCRRYSIDFAEAGEHHHAHQGWIQVNCPFCAGGTSGLHMGYSIETSVFHCWRCGTHKSLDTLAALLNTSSKAATLRAVQPFIVQDTGRDGPPSLTTAPEVTTGVRRRSCPIPPNLGVLRLQHTRYLEKRSFHPPTLAHTWDLQGCGPSGGLWAWRIVAPVRDSSGHVTAYLGRTIQDDMRPKYRMTGHEDIRQDPRSILYGIDKVPGESVVVVEGPTDVWRLGPGAVALLGIGWKVGQANILRSFEKRYIMLDPGHVAQAQAEHLAAWLGMFNGQTELITDLRTDPGDMSPEIARQVMDNLGMGGHNEG